MAVLSLQPGIIYGPVNSRRLGQSLGVNLLPTDAKLCSFDCIYCQYGRTRTKTLTPQAAQLPGADEALSAIEAALRGGADFDYLTFSGNGEASLHPDFPHIVRQTRRLLDELRPSVKLVILSNSSAAHLPRVREALATFDKPVMKLDAGDRRTFKRINRPAPGVALEATLEALVGLPGLVVQSVLVEGRLPNASGAAYQAGLAALAALRPGEVQIYSTDRPVPEAGVERVARERLREIAAEVENLLGVPAHAY